MVNKVILIGNLGRDPELRTFENGNKTCSFSVATNESYKDKNNVWQTVTEWHNVTAFGYVAEKAERDLKKGSSVYIEGKITYRKYNDKDGVEKNITEIVALTLNSLEKREKSNQFGTNAPEDKSESPF